MALESEFVQIRLDTHEARLGVKDRSAVCGLPQGHKYVCTFPVFSIIASPIWRHMKHSSKEKSEHTGVLHGCVCAHDSLCDVYHVQTFSLRTIAVVVLRAIHAKLRAVIK